MTFKIKRVSTQKFEFSLSIRGRYTPWINDRIPGDPSEDVFWSQMHLFTHENDATGSSILWVQTMTHMVSKRACLMMSFRLWMLGPNCAMTLCWVIISLLWVSMYIQLLAAPWQKLPLWWSHWLPDFSIPWPTFLYWSLPHFFQFLWNAVCLLTKYKWWALPISHQLCPAHPLCCRFSEKRLFYFSPWCADFIHCFTLGYYCTLV